jgi:phage major head subunit gpT-like protein
MILNRGNLTNLGVGFKTAFQGGLGQVKAQSERIATTVPSTTGSEEYGWLGQFPNVREFLGERVVQNMTLHDYTIKNREWELTIGVKRPHIEDDNLGIYAPMFTEMGRSTGAHREQLNFGLLKAGFASTCYDGQYFFDTDHLVLDESGAEVSVSNSGGGSGTPWFLIDDTRALKPILFQERKPFDFVARDQLTDDNVFDKNEFVYGAYGRHNVGFGFWQFAYGSRQTLDAAAYAAARAAMQGFKGDYGRPLGIMPTLLVVPPALEAVGREVLTAERTDAGATNVWRNTAELLVCPWLA